VALLLGRHPPDAGLTHRRRLLACRAARLLCPQVPASQPPARPPARPPAHPPAHPPVDNLLLEGRLGLRGPGVALVALVLLRLHLRGAQQGRKVSVERPCAPGPTQQPAAALLPPGAQAPRQALPPTCASTPAACSPPMTLMRALGHMNMKSGE
jgi:hypothetical protein